MPKTSIKVGVLFSATGSYAAIGQAMLAGVRLAIDEVNSDSSFPFSLEPVSIDPGGENSAYVDGTRTLLNEHGIVHVFGCYTSSSRKEVLPLFEKNDALLWYPSHYEGFETSENVIYTGASPNQHIVPLARYLLDNHGDQGWFVGSNYIWAWENNRILREALMEAGGAVLGERCFPIGEVDLTALVDQILEERPDFIFNTLIGESAYEFYRLLHRKSEELGINQSRDMPVASCSLSEVELPFLGSAAAGHLSSSVYFSTVETEENARFNVRWNHQYAHLGHSCADAEAAYMAIHFLARAIASAESADFEDVRRTAGGLQFAAPQGLVTLDPESMHCTMRPRIARSTNEGTFELLYQNDCAIRPDPYLVWTLNEQQRPPAFVPDLKVVL